MKAAFFDHMEKVLKDNKDVYLLLGGLGYPRVDSLLEKFPGRVINCEASEQTMLDIAVGLSYDGKYPVVYTITPFLYRGFETIRTYLNHEKLPCLLVGVGVDDDYSKHDGFSHDAKDIIDILGTLKNIKHYYPDNVQMLEEEINFCITDKNPSFLNIRR